MRPEPSAVTSWRELTEQSRSIAFELARDGDVEITQRGARVDPDRPSRGPSAFARKTNGDATVKPWPKPDPPGPGQESVWDYPRPPRLEELHGFDHR